MKHLDLHRAVGKLITGKVFGLELSAGEERMIKEGTISGVTLFKYNGDNLRQLAHLTDTMRSLGGTDFLLSVDQEGGAVQRFEHVISPMPSAMALAALDNVDVVRSIAGVHAQELGLLGINCNLVPVLDVNSNALNPIIATRSFGDDIPRIVRLASAMAAAYEEAGILPVGKHFPGHGDTAEDSHLQLAVVHGSKEVLMKRELAPFVATMNRLPAILVAHVCVPAYDTELLPASLSINVVTGLLRNKLGYDGFVMTDDMPGMKALADHWGLEEAAVKSINAGMDHLLMCGTEDQIRSVHASLVAAVERGVISEARLQESLRRRDKALRVSQRMVDLWQEQPLEARIEHISTLVEYGHLIALEASSAAIYQARGAIPNLLDSHAEWIVIAPNHPRYPMNIAAALNKLLPADKLIKTQLRYSINPDNEEIASLMAAAGRRNCIFLAYRALLNSEQRRLSSMLAETCAGGSVMISTDVPYDIAALPEWNNALAIFDPNELAMQALSHVLTGKSVPAGKCPVELGS